MMVPSPPLGGLRPRWEEAVSIMVATDFHGGIGFDGKLPWKIPQDWAFFQKIAGQSVNIMGRRCQEELKGSVLGKASYVLSRNPDFSAPEGWNQANSLENALSDAAQKYPFTNRLVCGGQEIYRQALPLADYLLITRIEKTFLADTFFPPWSGFFTRLLWEEKGSDPSVSLSFQLYARY